jgi:hypothetical protein
MTWSGVARQAIRFELAMWRSLFRWITRRPVVSGDGATAFGYSAAKAPVIWSRTVQVDEHVPSVVALSQTNVDIVLRGPTTLPVRGDGEPVTEVRLYADDPAALVAHARRHLTAEQDA